MTLKLPVYLDSHATTPCDPRVVEAMLPCFMEKFGNAASRRHAYGWEAEALVEQARERVAALINANPREIVFTSGATESDNLAVKGVARFHAAKGRHIVTGVTEHRAVLDSCARLEAEGFRVTRLPVTEEGRVRPEDVEAAIGPETTLVSLMFANNEIGSIHPVAEIGEICKRRGVFFHCDAVQALAHLPCDVQELGVDLLSISAHKMHGPKGAGALYVRRRDPRVRLEPMMDGGGHERGHRSGTLNVPGIVGLGMACELARLEGAADASRLAALRDRLLERLRAGLPELTINGGMTRRLPNNLNVSIPGADAEALLTALRDVAISTGSACASASLEPSYVLREIGASSAEAHASLRFGLHRFTTAVEIEFAAEAVIRAAGEARSAGTGAADSCEAPCRPVKT